MKILNIALFLLVPVGSMGTSLAMESDSSGEVDTQWMIDLESSTEEILPFLGDEGAYSEEDDLCDFGSDLNNQLYFALKQGGSLADIGALIEQGADVNAETMLYGSPLELFSQFGNLGACKILLAYGADVKEALIRAAASGHVEICKMLIKNGADVAMGESTALIVAAEEGHDKIVQMLIENGADVNAKNKPGLTPLLFAARGGHQEICKMLIKNGADVTVKDSLCRTPLVEAVRNGASIDVVQAMLEHAVIMPEVKAGEVKKLQEQFFAALCLFNRLNIIKDIRDYILSCDELTDEYLPLLIYLIKKGKQLPEPYRKAVAKKITHTTMDQLGPLLDRTCVLSDSDEMKSILDKDLLEENFGDKIYSNILKNLELLVRRSHHKFKI